MSLVQEPKSSHTRRVKPVEKDRKDREDRNENEKQDDLTLGILLWIAILALVVYLMTH